jgi:SAM-dependent methyltransferase
VDSKRRFSGRAGNYERHRPGYPAEVLTFIEAAFGLSKTSVVADVGSGTGLLSGLFLENGYRVFGVEPNREMREAAERRPGSCPCFRSVAVAAEATTLTAASMDLVASGNSFHWFDAQAARAEFSRVLKPSGRIAVLLNAPAKTGTPFLEAHERLLSEHASDGGDRICVCESIEDLYRGWKRSSAMAGTRRPVSGARGASTSRG